MTWLDDFNAYKLAVEYNFNPPRMHYKIRKRNAYAGNYEPFEPAAIEQPFMLFNHPQDHTSVLIKFSQVFS